MFPGMLSISDLVHLFEMRTLTGLPIHRPVLLTEALYFSLFGRCVAYIVTTDLTKYVKITIHQSPSRLQFRLVWRDMAGVADT